MAKRQKWTDGRVRQVFALRAEGKTMAEIGTIMGTGSGQVSNLLHRKVHGDVAITQNVLDKIAALPSTRRKVRSDKGAHVPQNPAMPQAMKAADPQYKDKPRYKCPRCSRMHHFAAGARGCCKGPDKPTYTEALDEAHAKITQPVKPVGNTKAQALMDILASVQHCNEMRQQLKELREKAIRLEALTTTKEEATFNRMVALGEQGFSPEFLNSLLAESGLCTDGKYTVE